MRCRLKGGAIGYGLKHDVDLLRCLHDSTGHIASDLNDKATPHPVVVADSKGVQKHLRRQPLDIQQAEATELGEPVAALEGVGDPGAHIRVGLQAQRRKVRGAGGLQPLREAGLVAAMPLQGDVPELARLAPQHEKVVNGPLEVGRGSPWAEDLDRLEIREQDPTKRVRELGLDNRVAVVAADDKAVEEVGGNGLNERQLDDSLQFVIVADGEI